MSPQSASFFPVKISLATQTRLPVFSRHGFWLVKDFDGGHKDFSWLINRLPLLLNRDIDCLPFYSLICYRARRGRRKSEHCRGEKASEARDSLALTRSFGEKRRTERNGNIIFSDRSRWEKSLNIQHDDLHFLVGDTALDAQRPLPRNIFKSFFFSRCVFWCANLCSS